MDIHPRTSATCGIHCIIEKLSKKWSLLILRVFTEQRKMRFSEILASLPEINSRILSERLTELEAEGLITRTVEDTKPVTCRYEITEKGLGLRSVFDGFVMWERQWGESDSRKSGDRISPKADSCCQIPDSRF